MDKFDNIFYSFFIISLTMGFGLVLKTYFRFMTAVTPYLTSDSGIPSSSFIPSLVMTTSGFSNSCAFPWRMWCPMIRTGFP